MLRKKSLFNKRFVSMPGIKNAGLNRHFLNVKIV